MVSNYGNTQIIRDLEKKSPERLGIKTHIELNENKGMIC